jgi:hypothetical protein
MGKKKNNAQPATDIETGGTSAGPGAPGESGAGLAGAAVSAAAVGTDLSAVDPAAATAPVAADNGASEPEPAAGSAGPAAPQEPAGDASTATAGTEQAASPADQSDAEKGALTDGQETQAQSADQQAGASSGSGDTDGQAIGDEPAVSDDQSGFIAPRYKCHKEVWALKIAALEIEADKSAKIAPKDDGYVSFRTAPGWAARFHGSEADLGYYVIYSDGYTSWSPSKPFEDGYTPIDGEGEEITFRTPLGIEELARGVGAAARLFANTWSGGEVDIFTKEEAGVMADFVRANPDAPVLAMFNHLTLTKRLARTSPNRDDEFVLTLFHAAVKAAHQLEADRAAEQAAKQPAPQGTWPGELGFKPQEPAFAPTGFSPR